MAQKRKAQFRELDSPDTFQVDKDGVMADIFSRGKLHGRSVVLDIDGTLIEFREGPWKHRAPKFRPFYREFVEGLSKFYNLFLFSSGFPIRSKNLFQKYFRDDFCGYFDRTLLHRRHKSLKAIDSEGHPLFVVDDSQEAIHQWSQHLHIPIRRWTGEPEDAELPRVLEVVQKAWALK